MSNYITPRCISIQSRLIALILGTVLVIEMAAGWMGYQRARHESDELFDAQLAQYAQILLSLVQDGEDDELEMIAIHGHPYQSKLLFQVWEMNHAPRLMLRTPEAPHYWPNGVAATGYSEVILAGHGWRFYAASAGGARLVLTAHDLHIRAEVARGIAWSNMTPYLLTLPLLTLLLLWAIRHGLKPLRALAVELTERDPSRLDDLPEIGPPGELQPSIRAMNQLFRRIRMAMDKERRFTSDAAHELRTPIAALRAQLQVAERTPDDQERQLAIAKALRGLERMTHLVAQLLSLARLETESIDHLDELVDFAEVAGGVIDEFANLVASKKIVLQAALAANSILKGNALLLRILIRNLLDNAFRYVSVEGAVRIDLICERGTVLFSVADDGPGVARENHPQLGARFQRFAPQRVEGVGLGLSIVLRIAELHNAQVTFGAGIADRGLGVRVTFPAARR